MLEAIQLLCLLLYIFAHLFNAATSNLFWGDDTISYAEGLQQRDPLGPLLFCLLLHQHSLKLKSEFQAFCLDDATLAGNCQDFVHNIQGMKEAVDLGLNLNAGKCEIISSTLLHVAPYWFHSPGVQVVPSSRVQLLESPSESLLAGRSHGIMRGLL